MNSTPNSGTEVVPEYVLDPKLIQAAQSMIGKSLDDYTDNSFNPLNQMYLTKNSPIGSLVFSQEAQIWPGMYTLISGKGELDIFVYVNSTTRLIRGIHMEYSSPQGTPLDSKVSLQYTLGEDIPNIIKNGGIEDLRAHVIRLLLRLEAHTN